METDRYICAEGDMRELRKGEQFPMCPRTGEETTWRPIDHQHRSGENVTATGMYMNADGKRAELRRGDIFPNCSKSGESTTWQHA